MKRFFRTIELLCGLLVISGGDLRAQAAPRLAGWWKLDDAPGATVLADASGNGRNALKGQGVSLTDGRFGGAARFDGTTNAWASFSNPRLTNMTIAAWIYMDGLPNNILPRIMQIGSEVYYLMPSNSLGQFSVGVRGNNWATNVQDPFKFTTNKWFHAAMVYRQEYTNDTDRVVWASFYINGVRCGDPGAKMAFSNDIPAGTAFFGNNSSGGGAVRPLTGLMDEVRLYDAPLSDREILALYQNRPLSVDAGHDQVCYQETAFLQGRLVNANPFMRDLAAGAAWRAVSAPEGAAPTIRFPWLPATSVSLPAAGAYTFRLTVSNELGLAADEVTLVRRDEAAPGDNAAPALTPLWTATNTVLGAAAPLAVTVADDGKPTNATRVCWAKVSGPGAAFFDDAFTNSTAVSFSTNGTYVLALTADDGASTRTTNVTVTVTPPSGSLSEGLAHWWRMDDDPALKKAFDSAGANTLSLNNQAFLQPGKTGYGYRGPKLDAVGVAATLPTNAETMTFSAWFYHDDGYVNRANGNRYQRLFNCGPNFYILYDPVVRQISLSTRGVGTADTQHTWVWPDTFTSNQWFHVAVLFDRRAMPANSRQAMYVNGKKSLSNTYASAFPGAVAFTSPFIIANTGATGGTRNFDGVLDDMRVFSRFITDEEARLLAADPDNNHAPVLEGPAALTAKVAHPVALQGVATDDGQPFGKTLSTGWTVVSGDSSRVLFSDASQPGSTATFTKTGDYVIMLAASDGERQTAALVTVTVQPTGSLVMLK